MGQPGHDIFSTPSNDDFYDAFAYDRMDAFKDEIRLLKVLPDHGGGSIECELQCNIPLSAIIGRYSALSYCAGDPTKTQSILVNGIRFQVFANLAHALAEARYFWKRVYGTRELLLWVDQICIDQQNITERSHQVGLMRDIYSSAEEVLVCLSVRRTKGKGLQWLQELYKSVPRRDDDLDEQHRRKDSFTLPMDAPHSRFHWGRLMKHLLVNLGKPKFFEGWLGIYDVFESPWWTRAWVYQEFMSAAQTHFLFGRESISWLALSPILDSYLSVVRYLVHQDEVFQKLQQRSNTSQYRRMNLVRERADRATQAEGMVAHMVESKLRWSGPTKLIDLLSISRHYATSDIRDIIYAFLGLAYPGYGIIPDYSSKKSICNLLIEVAKSIIQFDDNLEILTHTSDKGAFAGSLPSWVPDWTCKEEPAIRFNLKGEHTSSKDLCLSGWEKAHASFEYPVSNGHCIALKAWGAFAGVLQTEVARAPTTDDCLSAFHTSTGYQVLCTSHVQVLDELWVICGSQRPLILRKRDNGYSLVSVAVTLKEDGPDSVLCKDIMSEIIMGTLQKVQIAIY